MNKYFSEAMNLSLLKRQLNHLSNIYRKDALKLVFVHLNLIQLDFYSVDFVIQLKYQLYDHQMAVLHVSFNIYVKII